MAIICQLATDPQGVDIVADDVREVSFPWDASEDALGEWDRTFSSEEFAAYFGSFIGNGVFPNPSNGLLATGTNDTMTITLNPGQAFAEGRYYRLHDPMLLTVPPAHQLYRRIDAIFVRMDFLNRQSLIVYKEGNPASAPLSPTVERNSDGYELKLCEISIDVNATYIEDKDILDTRLDTSVCGIVVAAVENVDTEYIFQQYTQFLESKYIEWQVLQENFYERLEIDYQKFTDEIDIVRAFYNEIRTDITKLQSFNFDNLFELPGTEAETIFQEDGTIYEIIKKFETSDKIAERNTEFKEDGSIVIFTILYDEDGETILKQTEITTTFEDDGSIRSVMR